MWRENLSVNEFGYEEAKRLAIEARYKMISETDDYKIALNL